MKVKLFMPTPARGSQAGGVVCATDFSVHATQAATAAAAIAKRLRVPLLLVHVLDCTSFPNEIKKVLVELRQSGRRRLVSEAARLRKFGADVATELLEGQPETELVRVTQRPKSRMLVMASLGQIAISRMLVGSVAERTAESSPIPTLVIRDEKPFVEWAEGKRPLKIFLAADFTASSEAAMSWVKELRRIGPCRLIAGYIDWPPEAGSRLGVHCPPPFPHNPPEVQHVLDRDLREKIKQVLGDTTAQVRVEPGWGAPEFNLIEMAHQERADLFVVGTHQRHGLSRLFHPSISRAVLHHAPMSVACVPSRVGLRVAHIPEYHRVLVGTDLSELGNHAVPSAYSVLSHGGLVRLVHVVPLFEPANRLFAHPEKRLTKRSYEMRLERLSEKLRSLVPDEATARGIMTEVAVAQGRDAAAAVCEEAERFGADIICIGSHGHSGFAATVLGSVAQKIISRTRRPVLVVRPPPE
jgi:nucleotide-binding universal stress UspA family protein